MGKKFAELEAKMLPESRARSDAIHRQLLVSYKGQTRFSRGLISLEPEQAHKNGGLSPTDHHWMRRALELAAHGESRDEVPVGALVVLDEEAVGEGWNQPIGTHDPTAHAEIVALRAAGAQLRNYRLPRTTLYVTLEPCLMCVGAIVHARIARLVYGATDPKGGAVCSLCRGLELPGLNHRIEVSGGVMADACGDLLQRFFRARRGSRS